MEAGTLICAAASCKSRYLVRGTHVIADRCAAVVSAAVAGVSLSLSLSLSLCLSVYRADDDKLLYTDLHIKVWTGTSDAHTHTHTQTFSFRHAQLHRLFTLCQRLMRPSADVQRAPHPIRFHVGDVGGISRRRHRCCYYCY